MGLVADAPNKEITYKIIGAAMAVHNEHGPGHREEFYERALAMMFSKDEFGLMYEAECRFPVYNSDGNLIYAYRPDFLIEEAVIVEIKAHSQPLNKDEIAQVLVHIRYRSVYPLNICLSVSYPLTIPNIL